MIGRTGEKRRDKGKERGRFLGDDAGREDGLWEKRRREAGREEGRRGVELLLFRFRGCGCCSWRQCWTLEIMACEEKMERESGE